MDNVYEQLCHGKSKEELAVIAQTIECLNDNGSLKRIFKMSTFREAAYYQLTFGFTMTDE